jgi:hypothetical protein
MLVLSLSFRGLGYGYKLWAVFFGEGAVDAGLVLILPGLGYGYRVLFVFSSFKGFWGIKDEKRFVDDEIRRRRIWRTTG